MSPDSGPLVDRRVVSDRISQPGLTDRAQALMAGRQRRQLLAAVAILLLASLASASPALPSKNSPFCAAAKTPSFPHPPLPRQRDLAHACEAAVTHRGVHQDPLLLRLRGGGGGADAGSPGQERRVNMELQTHVGDDEDDFPEVEFKMEAEEMAKVILRVRVKPLPGNPTAQETVLQMKTILPRMKGKS